MRTISLFEQQQQKSGIFALTLKVLCKQLSKKERWKKKTKKEKCHKIKLSTND